MFTSLPERRNTLSLKWDKHPKNILPLWVADMDFPVASAIIEALHQRIDHGILGYSTPDKQIEQLIVERCKTRYKWDIQPEWIVWLPNLVAGLHVTTRAFIGSDQAVVVPVPAYHHFYTAIDGARAERISLQYVERHGRFELDIKACEQAIKASSKTAKLLMICNPHNPNGRVLCRGELDAIHRLAQQYQLLVCSDEIHCDLMLQPDLQHIPYASLNDETLMNSITLMSASKTFNTAGFCSAYAIIPNAQLREQFETTRLGIVPPPDLLGFVAAKAAFQHGEPWLTDVLQQLRSNHDYLIDAINRIDGMRMLPMEATYLAWIDVSGLQLDDVGQFFMDAGIAIIDGAQFAGDDFIRLNFATSRERLELAMERIEQAVSNRK